MVAIWFSQPLWSLPLPLPLPLWPPLSLPLFLPFFPRLGAKSKPVWVKKGVSWAGVESFPFGAFGCPEERVCLSLVLAQSRHGLCEEGEQGRADALKKRMAQLMGGQDACQSDEDDLEEEYDYGQYQVCGAKVEAWCPEGQERAGTTRVFETLFSLNSKNETWSRS